MHFMCNLSPITTNGNVESDLIDFVAHTKALTICIVFAIICCTDDGVSTWVHREGG